MNHFIYKIIVFGESDVNLGILKDEIHELWTMYATQSVNTRSIKWLTQVFIVHLTTSAGLPGKDTGGRRLPLKLIHTLVQGPSQKHRPTVHVSCIN